MMKKIFLLLALFTLVFSACKKGDSFDAAKQAAADDVKIQAYLKANPSITAIKDASGLYYQIITTGSGLAPTVNSTVRVAYTGKLLDGTQFETNPNISFPLSGVIQGWQIGIPFVKSGGRILLIIPSGLAYGHAGKGTIPPDTVLIFTIDLVSFQG